MNPFMKSVPMMSFPAKEIDVGILDQQRIKKAESAIGNFKKQENDLFGLNLIQTLVSQSRVAYADTNKQYTIVQTKYFNQLQQLANKCKNKIKGENSQIHEFQLTEKQLIQNLKEKQQRIRVLKAEVSAQKQKFTSIGINDIKKQNMMLEQSQQIEKLYNQNINIKRSCEQLQKKLRQTTKPLKSQVSKHIQTQLQVIDPKQILKDQTGRRGNVVQENNERKPEQHMIRLKQKFNDLLKDLERKLEDKVRQLEQSMVSVKKYEEEIEKLREENQNLTQKLYHIDQKERKLGIWENSLNSFLERAIADAQKNSELGDINDLFEEESSSYNQFGAKQKIKHLLQKLVELQSEKSTRQKKARQIIEIMKVSESDIADEGMVDNLVKLTLKVKKYVQYLIKQA